MPARRTPFAAAVLAVLAPASRADVLHVKGPTPDFAQISQAVAAAQDGDVLRVWPGTYGGFTIADRDLRVVRDPSPGAVVVQGVVRVQSLAAGKTVVLSGLDVTAGGGEGLIVFECSGAVRVQGCSLHGANGNVDPPDLHYRGFAGARIEASTDVAFSSCSLRGGVGVGFELNGAFRGGDGLRVQGSSVAFHSGDSTGGIGGSPWGQFSEGDGGPGGAGAWADAGATLFVGGSTFEGGRGGTGGEGCSLCKPAYGGQGGNGLAVDDAAAFTLATAFVPGEGGDPGTLGLAGPDGLELELGVDATLRQLHGRARSLSAPPLAADGTSIDLVVHGEPGDAVFLASSAGPAFQVVPGARGVWLLEGPWPRGASRVSSPGAGRAIVPTGDGALGTLGAGGTLVLPHVLAELPHGAASGTVYFQALVVSASGRVVLSDLATVVVIDGPL